MAQTERLYKLRHWLDGGGCLRPAWAERELEVSKSTLKRDIQHLRERLGMPIDWDAEHAGWRRRGPVANEPMQYELPGLWFSAEEVQALLTMQHLLSHLDAGGLLGPHIAPLMQRFGRILGSGVPAHAEVARRIRMHSVGARRLNLPQFQALGSALLRRQRLHLHYLARGRNERSEREVSPQRLIHYRDNWYLDAWCHQRQALRSFSVDAIEQVRVLAHPAIDIDDAELDAVLGAGYGIFAGRQLQRARLRFAPERARWVAAEIWHPAQHGRWDAEGRWLLDLPYADPRELVMDILRHVPDVEVLAPQELEDEVRRRLQAGLRQMGGLAGDLDE